jgi:hypothetical protein
MSIKKIKIGNPEKTKTGKTRILGMTVAQLTTLLERTAKKKEKSKIKNRIDRLTNLTEETQWKK